MSDLLFFIVTIVVLPVVINKSTEGERFNWIHPYLREIWTAVFVFYSWYLLSQPRVQEVLMLLHKDWNVFPTIRYVVVGIIGASLFCGYYWFAGQISEPKKSETKPDTVAKSPTVYDKRQEQSTLQEQQKIEPREPKPEVKPSPPKPKQIVKLHFKESPLFTEQRRQLIQREIDNFYEYLSGIGYELTKELPPLGVRNTPFESIVPPGDNIYRFEFNLREADIDKPDEISLTYAHHVFRKMFVGRFLNATESIFTQYYVSSLKGKNLNKGDDTKWPQAKWVNAIWDIRTQFRQGFADRLLFYVAKLWVMPKPDDEDFEKFFMQRFLADFR